MALGAKKIDLIQQLKVTENPETWKPFTNREIAEPLWVSVGIISKHTRPIANLFRQGLSALEIKDELNIQEADLNYLKELLDEQGTNIEDEIKTKIDELNDKVDKDIEDRTDKSAVWFDENDTCHFTITDVDQVTWEKDKIAIEIPLRVIDDIFLAYSSTMGNSMSEHEIMHEFQLYKYYKNPTKIWSVFRSRLGLNKNCTVRSYHTDAINKAKGEVEYNRLVEERVALWIKDRYTVDHKQQNKDLELKYLRKQIKEYQLRIGDQDIFLEAMKDYDIQPVKLNDKEPRNNKTLTVMMWDWHYESNVESIKERVETLTNDIISRDEWHIVLLGMWDWFEYLVSGGMHFDQELDIEIQDPRQKIQEVIELMIWMLNKLAESWVSVDFKMMNGNHCFIEDEKPEFLTTEWFKRFDEIVEEWYDVAQLNSNWEIEFVQPISIVDEVRMWTYIKYTACGSSNKEFTVTDWHDMIIDWEKIPARDLSTFKTSQTRECKGSYRFTNLDQLALLCIYDWSVVSYHSSNYYNAKNKGLDVDENTYKKRTRLQFKVSKPEKIKYIKDKLDELWIHYTFKVCKKSWWNVLQPYYIRIYSDTAREIYEYIGTEKRPPLQWYNMDDYSREIFKDITANTDWTLTWNVLRMYNSCEHLNWITWSLFNTSSYETSTWYEWCFENRKKCYETRFFVSDIEYKSVNYSWTHRVVDFEMPNWNLIVKVWWTIFNHWNCRTSQNSHADRYQLHGYRLTTVLQHAVQSSNVKIENLAERIQSFVEWDICYIVGHWDTNIYSKSAEELISMHWKPAKYYILAMWHLHSVRKKSGQIHKQYKNRKKDNWEQEWANYTQIIVPAMCNPWWYSEMSVVKRSAPWAVYVKPNWEINWRYVAPDVTTKRL